MLKKYFKELFSLASNDIRLFRLLMLIISFNYLAFSLINKSQLAGLSKGMQYINLLECFLFFCIYISTFYINPSKENINKLAILAAYIINTINIVLIPLSGFEDRFCYQYMIYFVLIALYFSSNHRFYVFQIINAILFSIILFIPIEKQSTHYSDMILTGYTAIILVFILSEVSNTKKLKNDDINEKFRLLAENASDIISVQNIKGEILYVSPSVKSQSGYDPQDLIGTSVLKLIQPESYSEIERYNTDLKENKLDNNTYLFYILNADKSCDWYEFKTKMNTDNTIVLNSRKVTSRIERQNLLNDKTFELESRNQDLITFSFIASHDMKEPLRMIIIYQKMLLKRLGNVNDDIQSYINTTLNAAQNLHQLVSELFSYTKLYEHELKRESFYCSKIVNNIIEKHQLYIKENNCSIISEGDVLLFADKQLFELVIQNLIMNGLKYNNNKTPSIQVHTFIDKDNIIIRIKDNGIGIDSKYYQKIFEPFARLHNKSEFQGTGLGLSISKKIIEKHNGQITVVSKLGEGSEFTLSFPLHTMVKPLD